MRMRKVSKIMDFKNEANEFLVKCLSKHNYWGGSETLKAALLKYEVNILIINEESSIYFANGFQSQLKDSVLLSYRLNHHYGIDGTGGIRNHYDSVVNIDPGTMVEMAEAMAARALNSNDEEVIVIDEL